MEEALHPINGCVLVKLSESLDFVDVPDKQYATKTSGRVLSVATEEAEYLLGKKVYFEEYKDGTQIEIDDTKYAFIKFEDIRGYSE